MPCETMDSIAKTKYPYAFSMERPKHSAYDDFSIKHPKMSNSQRAKIFSPFAALKGFEEVIDRKLEQYVDKHELTDEEQEELNEVLFSLHEKTRNSRLAKENFVRVSVSYTWPHNCGQTGLPQVPPLRCPANQKNLQRIR